MIKNSISLLTFFIFGMALMFCAEQGVPPTLAVTKTIKASETPQPTHTTQPTLTPTVTVTAMPVYRVIDEKTVDNLGIIYQWDVDDIFFGSTSFWFSDSEQFVLPVQKNSASGIQSFSSEKFAESWFEQIDYPSSVMVDKNEQVITYLHGLHIFDRQGKEAKTISTQDNCGKRLANYIVSIPESNLILTGHQDSYSDTGLNYTLDDKASLIIWNKDKNSCSILLSAINGRLFSLSVSPDGRYIGYSFGIRSKETGYWKKYTEIYSLNLQKRTCQLEGYISVFSQQNQLAIYNLDTDTISLVTPSDCKEQINFNVNIKLLALSFSPNGDLLAGVSESIVNIWNVKTGEKLKEIDLQASLNNLPLIGFSPDSRFLVVTKNRASPAEKDKVMLWGVLEK
ncbi:MAG TPA: hypothetical protein DCG54_00250 [Anaerolineae bacterium]|nr:hypothetical protein [Anaerolineae bacterium]